MSLTITSSAFVNDGAIPELYTCEGRDISPPLAWSGAPDTATSFVLIVHDPDTAVASQTNGAEDTLHWLV